MTPLIIHVPSNPRPWQRALRGNGATYNDKGVGRYKDSVSLCAIAAWKRSRLAWDVSGRYSLTVIVHRQTAQRFDSDRMLSTFCDALCQKRDKAGRVIRAGLLYDDTAAHLPHVELIVGAVDKARPRAVLCLRPAAEVEAMAGRVEQAWEVA